MADPDNGRTPPLGALTPNNPAPITLSAGKVVDVKLEDAASNTASTVLRLEHGTTATPVATQSPTSSFGSDLEFDLDSTIHAKLVGSIIRTWWRVVGPAAVNSAGAVSIMLLIGGVPVEVARFTDGDFQAIATQGATYPGLSFTNDNRMGVSLDGGNRTCLAHASVECLSVDSSAGVPRIGVLGNVGSPAPAQSVGATPTNNVAATGSANVYPDFTNGTTYATDYAALHATISQLCAKVAAMDAALKLFGYLKV